MNRSSLTTIDPALETNPAKLTTQLRRIWPWIWDLLPDTSNKSRFWVFDAIHALGHCVRRAFFGKSHQNRNHALGVQPAVIDEVAQYRKPVAEIASYYADL